MTVWTGTEELAADLARLVTNHDAAWDAMTDKGISRDARKDPEVQYHWGASEACETVLDDLRNRMYDYHLAELCPERCGCRGNGRRT